MLLATVFTDPPWAAGAAAAFTLLAGPSIARAARAGGDALRAEERRQILSGAALGLWVALCAGYPALRSPGWMLSYAEGAKRISLLVWYPAFGLCAMACGALGAFLSCACLARGERRLARLIASGFFAIWLMLFAATWSRMLVAGSWEQAENGTALPLAAQPGIAVAFGLSLLALVAGIAAAAAVRLRHQRGESAGPSAPAVP